MHPIRNSPDAWRLCEPRTETRRKGYPRSGGNDALFANPQQQETDIEDLSGIVAFIPNGERETFLFARACSICNDLRGGF